jgi:hypothetical protein
MFVQVIKGHTSDGAGLRGQLERWLEDVKPGAIGVLGSTVGVADDGTFIAIARFEDEASATANAARAEQTQWWNETEKYFDGPPSFRESSDTATLFDAGMDNATFVQVMEGTIKDRAKAEALETPEMVAQLRKARPDLLGTFRVLFDNDEFVETAYFTSEADARTGEKSGDFEAGPGQEFMELFGDMSFLDLRDPLLG